MRTENTPPSEERALENFKILLGLVLPIVPREDHALVCRRLREELLGAVGPIWRASHNRVRQWGFAERHRINSDIKRWKGLEA